MSKFKIGDHVEITNNGDRKFFRLGAAGTVVELGYDGTVRVNFTYGNFYTQLNEELGGLWVCEYKLNCDILASSK